jgi:Na+/citrate or Na+/malate symporter
VTVLSPITAMALPPMVIGTVIGTATWVPPRRPPMPEVLIPPMAGATGAGAVPEPPVTALVPTTEMPLPTTETGAVTGATT